MMEYEFKEQIKRLRGTYGVDTYPREVVTALFRELFHIDGKRFKKAIDRVLADNPNPKYPPGISKIEKELAKMRDEDHEWRKEKRSEIKGNVSGSQASKALGEILGSIK